MEDKQLESKFKDSFIDEMLLIEEELRETDALYNQIKGHFDSVMNSRSSGTLKFIGDQAKTLVSLRTHKLSIIKDRVNVKKTVAELDMKDEGLKLRASDGGSAIESLKEVAAMLSKNAENPSQVVSPNNIIYEDEDGNDRIEQILNSVDLTSRLDDADEEVVEIVVDLQGNFYALDEEGQVMDDYPHLPKYKPRFIKEEDGIKAYDPYGEEIVIVDVVNEN